MLSEIIELTKEFNPQVFTESCEDYPTLKEGDAVIDFPDKDITLVLEGAVHQLLIGEWVGDFENPIPALLLALNGNVMIAEDKDGVPTAFIVEDQNSSAYRSCDCNPDNTTIE